MKHVVVAVLLLAVVGVAACGSDAPESSSAPPVVVVSDLDSIRQTPADVVRLWLDAAKRGDAEAMSALWAEEERPRVKTSPHSFASRVASGTLHAATWHVGAEAGKGEKRTVTAHLVWREHPDGGDNLEFRFVRRDGRWWLVGIAHFD